MILDVRTACAVQLHAGWDERRVAGDVLIGESVRLGRVSAVAGELHNFAHLIPARPLVKPSAAEG